MLLNPFSLPKLFQKVLQKKHGGFGHSIMAGEMYAKVVYLQKSVERKKIVKSQKPNISINEDLSLVSLGLSGSSLILLLLY